MEKLWDYNFETCKNQPEFLKILAKYPWCNAEYLVAACRPKFKERIEKYWEAHKKYADTKFLKKLKKEDFIWRSWEMFMSYLLTEQDFQLSSNNEWPDLIINNSIYLECIAPKKWEWEDKVTNHEITNKVSSYTIEEEKMILRMCSWIEEKLKKYESSWSRKHWF